MLVEAVLLKPFGHIAGFLDEKGLQSSISYTWFLTHN